MVSFKARELEQIRASSDLREGRVRRFVDDQLDHADPRAAAARQVLQGDRAVWQLVDQVQEFDELEQGMVTIDEILARMDPGEQQQLRQAAGVDAAAMQELLRPEPGEPSLEAAFYLDQLGARQVVSIDAVSDFFGIDVFGSFGPADTNQPEPGAGEATGRHR